MESSGRWKTIGKLVAVGVSSFLLGLLWWFFVDTEKPPSYPIPASLWVYATLMAVGMGCILPINSCYVHEPKANLGKALLVSLAYSLAVWLTALALAPTYGWTLGKCNWIGLNGHWIGAMGWLMITKLPRFFSPNP